MLLLDTHVFVDALTGRLRQGEEQLLDDFWSISDITLWEIAALSREGRIRLGPTDPLLEDALKRMTVWPIDLAIARALRRLDFRSDPADQIIAATSLALSIPLVTRDTRILASRVVPLAGP